MLEAFWSEKFKREEADILIGYVKCNMKYDWLVFLIFNVSFICYLSMKCHRQMKSVMELANLPISSK